MKKVIIPFDGGHFSDGAFSFALDLHKAKPVLLTGIFLPQVDYARFVFFPTAFMSPLYMPIKETFDDTEIDSNVERFTALCKENNIEYTIHKDLIDFAVPQLTKETRFADLMIIGSEVFYKNIEANESSEYLSNTLHHSECPVVIVPEQFKFPTSIILAYDGTASSVFAIKQFAHLFPELCLSCKTILVYAGDEKHPIPDKENIEELVGRHFTNLSIDKITMDHNKDFFINWLNEHENSLLVSGSFGRSGVSELFSQSFVIRIIREHKTPVFIAHQ
jgi:hypothetical protein